MATQVQKLLEARLFDAVVGGNESPAHQFRSHFLNERVIAQMNNTDRAIILTQWPPEDTREQLADAETAAHTRRKPASNRRKPPDNPFRPNLLFEWGFLLSRFQKLPYLHVFLIGRRRH